MNKILFEELPRLMFALQALADWRESGKPEAYMIDDNNKEDYTMLEIDQILHN